MKVTLINYTQRAVDLLLFTKQTRLTLSPTLLHEIEQWPQEKKDAELAYMAKTIPSSWEFVNYVFLVEGVSRAYTHQQVRTRAASYAQQSLRVTNMDEFNYVFTEKNLASEQAYRAIEACLDRIKDTYSVLRRMGQAPEDARGILPTNIATNIICQFNLRTMAELAKSRTGGRTQNEYITVVNAMVDALVAVHPWAEQFLFANHDRHYFDELEAWAAANLPDMRQRGELLKIIDGMRKT